MKPASRILRAHELAAFRAADEVLAEARAAAQRIEADARAAAEAARRAAADQGRAEAAAAATRMIAETEARIDAALAALEPRLAELVLHATRRLLAGFDRRDLVARLAATALAEARAARRIVLRVAPQCVDATRAALAGLEAPGQQLAVAADPALADTDCVLDSELGSVHAGLRPQIEALRQALAPRRAAAAE